MSLHSGFGWLIHVLAVYAEGLVLLQTVGVKVRLSTGRPFCAFFCLFSLDMLFYI